MPKSLRAKTIQLTLTPIVILVAVGLTLLGLETRPAYADGPITINLDDLPTGKAITITFQAGITNPFGRSGLQSGHTLRQ